jgi:hypothetical protein
MFSILPEIAFSPKMSCLSLSPVGGPATPSLPTLVAGDMDGRLVTFGSLAKGLRRILGFFMTGEVAASPGFRFLLMVTCLVSCLARVLHMLTGWRWEREWEEPAPTRLIYQSGGLVPEGLTAMSVTSIKQRNPITDWITSALETAAWA